MASGGYRPNAGRPKGSRSIKDTNALPPDIKAAARKAKMAPLDYMLAVMSDETNDPHRRDRMAMAAAPFCHERVGIPRSAPATDPADDVTDEPAS